MKMKKKLLSFIGTALVLAVMLPGYAQADVRYEYDLKWGMVLAGHSVMSLTNAVENSPAFIESRTVSAKWINSFYPVLNVIRVELDDAENLYPDFYHMKLREGKSRKDKQMDYVRAEGKLYYKDNRSGKEREFDIPEEIHDPLTAFFSIKDLDLVVGKSVYIKMFDSMKIWDLEVRVHKKEKVRVPAGTFMAYKVEPIMKSEGIFKSKGRLIIWISADERRIPVKVRTKASIGSVTAYLKGGQF